MDQKNTIVKCTANPNCLFNHNGVCDNYIISIGADGKCDCYVETATEEDVKKGVIGEYKTINATCGDCEYFGNIDNCPVYKRTHVLFGMDPICLDFKAKRVQRAKSNFFDDACDVSFLKEGLEKIQQTLEQDFIPCVMKVAELNKTNKNESTIKEIGHASPKGYFGVDDFL